MRKEDKQMEKIKLLSVGNKKMKVSEMELWEDLVDRYAPDLYENYYAVGEKEALKKETELKPEITLVANVMKNTLELVKALKHSNPEGVILVVLGMVDDEQETMKAFQAQGAYKCYSVPLSVDTLIHDMYVALNLE